jgi:putative isomerase
MQSNDFQPAKQSEMPLVYLLKDRIDLEKVPFTDRGSRLLVLRQGMSLQIRLAERWYGRDPTLSAYRKRTPIVHDMGLTDGDGRRLDFTLQTYPHMVVLHTDIGIFRLAFWDTETLYLQLPAVKCGVCFEAEVDQGQADRRGGILRLSGNVRRNIAYTTNRAIETNQIERVGPEHQRVCITVREGEPGGFLLNLTPRLGFNRYIPLLEQVFNDAEQRWEAWFSSVPPVHGDYREQYYYAWWIMRAGLVSSRFYTTRESLMPSKIHYVGVWQWDQYFHALAYRHIDPALARDQLRVLVDHQRVDGMIPDAVHDEGTITHLNFPVDADVTKPPLASWAVWKLYELDGDREFLEEVYEPLVRLTHWWLEQNDFDQDGLCEYQHPFSSGLDDSPLWDEGMPVTAPDLNTYMVLQMESLSRMAAVLDLREEAAQWETRAEAFMNKMMERLWSQEGGLFNALLNDAPVNVQTPFSLFPLLTGRLPEEVTRRLVTRLTDTNTFWTRFPVPTVAKNDPKYDPWQMWRGPVWVNVNYMLIEGLIRSGIPELAAELRRKTLEMLMGHKDFYEYYHPENGEPGPKAAPIFGWSAALFIELAIQDARMPGRVMLKSAGRENP